MVCNLRLGPDMSVDETFKIVNECAVRHDLEAEVMSGCGVSRLADTDNADFERLVSALHEGYPDIGVGTYMLFGGTDCRKFEELSDHTYRMTPLRISSRQFTAVHGIDENIDLSALIETIEFYKLLAAGGEQ